MENVKFSFVSDTEKEIFHRIVRIGLDIQPSKKVMSYWMFLQSHNFHDKFYHKIFTCDDKFFKDLCAEAGIALVFLESNSSSLSQDSCPLTSQLLKPIFSLKEMLLNKEKVNNEISFIFDTFCCDGFEDTLEDKITKKIDGEGSSKKDEKVNLALNSKLNPLAKEWNPSGKSSVELRSLFMTFSLGYSISSEEISDFFNRTYGDCVEDVYIYQKGGDTTFGKVVFKSAYTCALIMRGGRDTARFYIGSRPIWMKKYKPAHNFVA